MPEARVSKDCEFSREILVWTLGNSGDTDADAVHQGAQKVGSMVADRNLVGLVSNAGIVVTGPLLYLRPS